MTSEDLLSLGIELSVNLFLSNPKKNTVVGSTFNDLVEKFLATCKNKRTQSC